MDVARLNLSHGSHADHEKVYRMVREASDATGHGVGDLRRPAGPQDPARHLRRRAGRAERRATTFTITTRDVAGRRRDLRRRRTTGCPATSRPATRSSSTTARSGSG